MYLRACNHRVTARFRQDVRTITDKYDGSEARVHKGLHWHLADNGLNEAVHDIVETAKHTVACIDDDGKASVAVIYMSGANKKVSDAWNTALAQSGTDRFGTVWALESVEEKNRMGQGYQVFKATNKGYPTPELYAEARATYFAMKGMTDPTIH